MASFADSNSKTKQRGHSRTRSGLGGANRRAPPSVVLNSIAAVNGATQRAPKKDPKKYFFYFKRSGETAKLPKPVKSKKRKGKEGHNIPPPHGLKGQYKNFCNPLVSIEIKKKTTNGKTNRIPPPRPRSRAPGSIDSTDPRSFGHVRGGSMSRAPTGRLPVKKDIALTNNTRTKGKKAFKRKEEDLAGPKPSGSTDGTQNTSTHSKRANRLRMMKKQGNGRKFLISN